MKCAEKKIETIKKCYSNSARACAAGLPWYFFERIDVSIIVVVEYGPAHDIYSVQLDWIFWKQHLMDMDPNICSWETITQKPFRYNKNKSNQIPWCSRGKPKGNN